MAPLSLRRLAWFDVLSRSESQVLPEITQRFGAQMIIRWAVQYAKISATRISPIERFTIGDFALLLDAALDNSVICAHR